MFVFLFKKKRRTKTNAKSAKSFYLKKKKNLQIVHLICCQTYTLFMRRYVIKIMINDLWLRLVSHNLDVIVVNIKKKIIR